MGSEVEQSHGYLLEGALYFIVGLYSYDGEGTRAWRPYQT